MKKKAFTLIELLAVIVILAVIALIVIPLILGIINDAKYKKYKVEEGNIKEAAKLYYASKNIEEKDQDEVSLKTLVDTKFMNPVVDTITGKECEGKAIKLKDGKLKGCLKCSNYVTKGCGYIQDEDDEEGKPEPDIVDNNPGIICGDKSEEDYNNVTECHIRSVEDLVEFTKMIKSKYDFSGKTVYLDKNLDIKDYKKGNSYVDPDALASFDINGDGEITSLKDEMTTDGGFYPIGESYYVAFLGRFEGNAKTIKNLMINRPNTDYVGLFGFVRGTVLGLNLADANVIGNNNVGGMVGLNYGDVYEVKVSGNITGNNYVYGVARNAYSAIVNANVTGNNYVYGVGENGYGIMKSGTVKGNNNVYAGSGSIYSSTSRWGSVLVNKKVILEISGEQVSIGEAKYEDTVYGNLNLYDTPLGNCSLDTYLSGDENGSGYYFDYNSKGEIVIKSTKKYPIDTTLKTLKPEKDNDGGTQDNPYLIYTYEDMKKIAVISTEQNYYLLMNDIDFKGKKYYMIGTKSHPFKGYFDGNGHTLKNVILEGYSNVGIFGYIYGITDSSTKSIVGLNVDGLTVLGQSDNIGGLVGYLERTNIIGVNLNDVNVKGNNYVGGIVGFNYIASVREATINGNITGNNYTSGAIGNSNGSNINILANVNVTGNENVYGLGQNVEGIVEGGNITGNKNVYGASSCSSTCGSSCQCWGDTYINTDVVVNAPDGEWDYGAIRIPSNTYNNLREYSLLKHKWSSESHIFILETPYSGDIDDSKYYFDYNDSGTDIIVVKTNSKTPINPNIDPNNPDSPISPEIVHQVIKDNTKPLPECELTRFNVYGKGFTASYSCTDEEEIIERKHIYWVKSDVDDYDSLIMWASITPASNVLVNSVWTESSAANQKIDPPYPNNCYYFYYGAKNKVGNEVIYKTGYCLEY